MKVYITILSCNSITFFSFYMKVQTQKDKKGYRLSLLAREAIQPLGVYKSIFCSFLGNINLCGFRCNVNHLVIQN